MGSEWRRKIGITEKSANVLCKDAKVVLFVCYGSVLGMSQQATKLHSNSVVLKAIKFKTLYRHCDT